MVCGKACMELISDKVPASLHSRSSVGVPRGSELKGTDNHNEIISDQSLRGIYSL